MRRRRQNFLFLLCISLFALPSIGSAKRVGKGLYFKILKLSDTKKTFIMNRGKEENLKAGDHAKIYFNKQKLAHAKLVQIAPSRSIWEVFEFFDRDAIEKDKVYYFTLTDPVIFTPDTNTEEPLLVLQDMTPPEEKFHPAFYRFEFLMGFSTRSGSQYEFPSNIAEDPHGQQYNLLAIWSQRFHDAPKVFWGLLTSALMMRSHFNLVNQSRVEEKKVIFGFGPYLAYDIYGSMSQRAVGYISAIWNVIHNVTLSQTSSINIRDEAKFSGRSLSSLVGLKYQRLDIFEKINLLASISARVNFSHSLSSDEPLANNGFWSSEQISNRRSTDVEYMLGVQYPY